MQLHGGSVVVLVDDVDVLDVDVVLVVVPVVVVVEVVVVLVELVVVVGREQWFPLIDQLFDALSQVQSQ